MYTHVLQIRPSFWFGFKFLSLMQTKMWRFHSNFKQIIAWYTYKISFDKPYNEFKWSEMRVKSSEYWLICQCSMRPKQWNNGGWTSSTAHSDATYQYLLINLWFLSQYQMKFNDIFHKYKQNFFDPMVKLLFRWSEPNPIFQRYFFRGPNFGYTGIYSWSSWNSNNTAYKPISWNSAFPSFFKMDK